MPTQTRLYRSAWRAGIASIVGLALVAGGVACSSGSSVSKSSRGGEGTDSQVSGNTATAHYAVGTDTDQRVALSLGFNVLDISGNKTDPRLTKTVVDALPPGVRALIWVGNLDNTNCTTPGYTTAQFDALVDAMASDTKVYGYYIADEPHPLTCTSAVADIRARADYLHAHSGFQKAFIVVQDGSKICDGSIGCEFHALQPSKTHVDLIGLDPYPCHYDPQGHRVPCDYSMIDQRVAAATANGIPPNMIVPVFQAFGQAGRTTGTVYYRTPSTGELRTMLNIWKQLLPAPVMDDTYSFGIQCSRSSCPAAQALVNHRELWADVVAHNR